ncbi:terminase large subunit domain-containing protein [Scytonema sp. PCC 10023]|uniref:phage terminase large subunit family protein n=1 Tax=Scytonema sp. PCC 10023 TaxID=1680591 RepID=UPI0039C6A675
MVLTSAKLRQIEKRVQRRQTKLEGETLQIPECWTDFARMVKIRSGGDVKPFNPYPYQEELVQLMLQRSVCVVKSRQLGISETVTCFMLWRACLNPGYLGLVFSKTQTDSSLLARRMKRMIASLGLKTTTENLSDIEIQGYGRILFRNSKPDSARGIESVVDCFLDELAFLETAKEVFDSVTPAMQMVGDKARVFAVSTPNGRAGFYWDLLNNGNGGRDIELICNQASKGESKPFQYWVDDGGWGKVLIHWRSHPIYGSNPNFLEEIHQKQKLSWATIQQEYNLSFTEAETAVFSAEIVRECATGRLENEIDNDADYYIGIDTSTTGSDYCVAVVLKVKNGQYSLVTFYRKRQQTSEFHLFEIGKLIDKYEPKTVGIETTGGVGTLYLEQLTKQHKNINFQAIRTSGDSKPAMVSTLQLALESRKLRFPVDSPLTEELLNFRRSGKKLEAANGKHDDCVMATTFALTVSPINEKESIWNII